MTRDGLMDTKTGGCVIEMEAFWRWEQLGVWSSLGLGSLFVKERRGTWAHFKHKGIETVFFSQTSSHSIDKVVASRLIGLTEEVTSDKH